MRFLILKVLLDRIEKKIYDKNLFQSLWSEFCQCRVIFNIRQSKKGFPEYRAFEVINRYNNLQKQYFLILSLTGAFFSRAFRTQGVAVEWEAALHSLVSWDLFATSSMNDTPLEFCQSMSHT